jgi:choline dehydrogenase
VVLCAGALQSPAVLMRSGIGPAGHLRSLGIQPVEDRPGVGQNLIDHPVAPFGLVLKTPVDPGASVWPPCCYVRFASGAGEESNDVIIAAWNRHIVLDNDRSFGAMWVKCATVDARGQVRLQSANPDDQPVVEMRMLSDTRDLRRLHAGVRRFMEIARQPQFAGVVEGVLTRGAQGSLGELADGAALDEWLLSSCDSIYHPAGTCRMGGLDDLEAVVDPGCNVIGVEGLRIVDASVMPTIPRANTNLTCIMLAEHAAAAWGRASA